MWMVLELVQYPDIAEIDPEASKEFLMAVRRSPELREAVLQAISDQVEP